MYVRVCKIIYEYIGSTCSQEFGARNTDIFMYAQVMRNALNSGRRARATEGVRL